MYKYPKSDPGNRESTEASWASADHKKITFKLGNHTYPNCEVQQAGAETVWVIVEEYNLPGSWLRVKIKVRNIKS